MTHTPRFQHHYQRPMIMVLESGGVSSGACVLFLVSSVVSSAMVCPLSSDPSVCTYVLIINYILKHSCLHGIVNFEC